MDFLRPSQPKTSLALTPGHSGYRQTGFTPSTAGAHLFQGPCFAAVVGPTRGNAPPGRIRGLMRRRSLWPVESPNRLAENRLHTRHGKNSRREPVEDFPHRFRRRLRQIAPDDERRRGPPRFPLPTKLPPAPRRSGRCPTFIGIRIKPLNEESRGAQPSATPAAFFLGRASGRPSGKFHSGRFPKITVA